VNSTKIIVEQGLETKTLAASFAHAQTNLFTSNVFDPISGYMFGDFFGSLFAHQCRHTLHQEGLIEKLE
ncbi:hypothetical protein PMAYCL1PPCAC_00323, partial [Pristionchus mayeri]